MTEIACLEKKLTEQIGNRYTVALSCGSAALHLAVKLAAEKVYGNTDCGYGLLKGKNVFVPNFADRAVVNAVLYEGGEPVFIDVSPESWGIDPEVLETAFDCYPDVKIVIATHVYGFPCQIDELKEICAINGALLIEDARDALGAKLNGKMVGSFGDYGVLGFGNSSVVDAGGALITDDEYGVEKAHNWAIGKRILPQSDEVIGYNYVISPLAAKVAVEKLETLDGKIEERRKIYEAYAEKFPDYIAELNPITDGAEPNYAQIAMTVESDICFEEERFDDGYSYESTHGTASPMQIMETLAYKGLRAKPVYQPLSAQSEFMSCEDITLDGKKSEYEFADNADFMVRADESTRIWKHGICLPMEIGKIGETVKAVFECFDGEKTGTF